MSIDFLCLCMLRNAEWWGLSWLFGSLISCSGIDHVPFGGIGEGRQIAVGPVLDTGAREIGRVPVPVAGEKHAAVELRCERLSPLVRGGRIVGGTHHQDRWRPRGVERPGLPVGGTGQKAQMSEPHASVAPKSGACAANCFANST